LILGVLARTGCQGTGVWEEALVSWRVGPLLSAG